MQLTIHSRNKYDRDDIHQEFPHLAISNNKPDRFDVVFDSIKYPHYYCDIQEWAHNGELPVTHIQSR